MTTMTAQYAIGSARGIGEQCENCDRIAKVGDKVYVYGIGGGWSHLCSECYTDHVADRETGQILGDDSPDFTEAVAV